MFFFIIGSCLNQYQYSDDNGLKWFKGSEVVRSYSSRRQSTTTTAYLYIPGTNDPRIKGRWTDIVSPPITFLKNGCLYFNLRNTACGLNKTEEQLNTPHINFKVYLRSKTGERYTPDTDVLLQEYPCLNTSDWFITKLPITAPAGSYKLVFSGRHHEDPDQVVALTNIRFSGSSCSLQVCNNKVISRHSIVHV